MGKNVGETQWVTIFNMLNAHITIIKNLLHKYPWTCVPDGNQIMVHKVKNASYE